LKQLHYELKTVEMIVSERKKEPVKITNPIDTYLALKRYQNKRQEHFLILTLNGAHFVIAIRIISIGLVNRTIVHPREVFAPAITDNAVAIILAHNHPSGQTYPSNDDLEITKRLVSAGQILGIEIVDHVIIGKDNYYSFLEYGLITKAIHEDIQNIIK